jgi:hypothetical protein
MRLYAEGCDFFKKQGLSLTEFTGKSRKSTTAKYLEAYHEALLKKHAYHDYMELSAISQMETHIKAALDYAKEESQKTIKLQAEHERLEAYYELAQSYLTEAEIAAARSLGSTADQLGKLIETRHEEKHQGEAIDISCCDECDTYTIGDRRCSCGNRRISASAEIWYSTSEKKAYVSFNTEPY